MALESDEDFDTIYGVRTIGNNEDWLSLQATLIRLARDDQIDLKHFEKIIASISAYFTKE